MNQAATAGVGGGALPNDAKSEDETRVLAATAALTFLAALGVSGGTNLAMILTKDPIIKKHKPTLAFASAWIGDGLLKKSEPGAVLRESEIVTGLRHSGKIAGEGHVDQQVPGKLMLDAKVVLVCPRNLVNQRGGVCSLTVVAEQP